MRNSQLLKDGWCIAGIDFRVFAAKHLKLDRNLCLQKVSHTLFSMRRRIDCPSGAPVTSTTVYCSPSVVATNRTTFELYGLDADTISECLSIIGHENSHYR